uniref:Uncharacterized protein n=1 Tax=Ciona intestinalis TaxID=7719 RepID=H2XPU8_CIOIN
MLLDHWCYFWGGDAPISFGMRTLAGHSRVVALTQWLLMSCANYLSSIYHCQYEDV